MGINLTIVLYTLLMLIITAVIIYIKVLRVKLSYGICRCSKHLVGKVAIVTGSNIGIGFENAKDFAYRGAKVILACRNEERGTKARDEIIKATGNQDVHLYKLDLSSLESVRAFAEKVKRKEKKLDILVNNAGDLDMEFTKTEDGLLLSMQVNFFGPFLLTNLLLPLLKASAPSRIVNVGSSAYKIARLNLKDLNVVPEPRIFAKMGVYANAKLCTMLTSLELSKRLQGTGVTVNCLCPGYVATDITNTVKNRYWKKCFEWKTALEAKDCWQGAQTQIYLSVAPEFDDISGFFYVDCQKKDLEDFAKDPEKAKKIWEISEGLVGLNTFDKDK